MDRAEGLDEGAVADVAGRGHDALGPRRGRLAKVRGDDPLAGSQEPRHEGMAHLAAGARHHDHAGVTFSNAHGSHPSSIEAWPTRARPQAKARVYGGGWARRSLGVLSGVAGMGRPRGAHRLSAPPPYAFEEAQSPAAASASRNSPVRGERSLELREHRFEPRLRRRAVELDTEPLREIEFIEDAAATIADQFSLPRERLAAVHRLELRPQQIHALLPLEDRRGRRLRRQLLEQFLAKREPRPMEPRLDRLGLHAEHASGLLDGEFEQVLEKKRHAEGVRQRRDGFLHPCDGLGVLDPRRRLAFDEIGGDRIVEGHDLLERRHAAIAAERPAMAALPRPHRDRVEPRARLAAAVEGLPSPVRLHEGVLHDLVRVARRTAQANPERMDHRRVLAKERGDRVARGAFGLCPRCGRCCVWRVLPGDHRRDRTRASARGRRRASIRVARCTTPTT